MDDRTDQLLWLASEWAARPQPGTPAGIAALDAFPDKFINIVGRLHVAL